MNTHFMKDVTNVLPPGEYFIGDLCYFLNDPIVDVWSFDFKKNDGVFTTDNGLGFGVIKPYSGNGIYIGSNRFSYDVEDMNLGIASTTFGDTSKYNGCGTFHKFNKPVIMDWVEGVIYFKSDKWTMNIDTNHNDALDSDDMDGYDSWS